MLQACLSNCCICFTHILQVFYLDVSYGMRIESGRGCEPSPRVVGWRGQCPDGMGPVWERETQAWTETCWRELRHRGQVRVGETECSAGIRTQQHIRRKPINLCKLRNYQSGPLDVDPMDGVRGLKRKKRPAGGGLKRKKIPPLTPSIGSASSGSDW